MGEIGNVTPALEKLGYEWGRIDEAATLRGDLGLGSLDLVEVTIWLEDAHEIEIADREIEAVATVGELAELVRRKKSERACRICGCTEGNACVAPDGDVCGWHEADFCTMCAGYLVADVLLDVGAERRRQDIRWGGPSHDDGRGQRDWHLLIGRLLREAQEASLVNDTGNYRRHMIQAAAVIVASVEALDRREGADHA